MTEDDKKIISDEDDIDEVVDELEEETGEKKSDIEEGGDSEEDEITLEATNEAFDDDAYIKALEAMSEEDEDFDFLNPYKEQDLKSKQKKFEQDNRLNESDLDSVEKDDNIDD